jgi:hypothetical protein
LWEKLQAAAEQNLRSINAELAWILQQYFQDNAPAPKRAKKGEGR